MTAVVIDLAEARAERQAARGGVSHSTHIGDAEGSVRASLPSGKERFQFWTGASGTRYVHTVYDFVTCPTLPAANYMLVKRSFSDDIEVLAIGQVTNDASSLNLAEVRRRGAQLGATEVHVHLLAEDTNQAQHIQQDLQTGYLNAAWPSQASAVAH